MGHKGVPMKSFLALFVLLLSFHSIADGSRGWVKLKIVNVDCGEQLEKDVRELVLKKLEELEFTTRKIEGQPYVYALNIKMYQHKNYSVVEMNKYRKGYGLVMAEGGPVTEDTAADHYLMHVKRAVEGQLLK